MTKSNSSSNKKQSCPVQATYTETVPVDRLNKLLTADYDLGFDTVRSLIRMIENGGVNTVEYTYGRNKKTDEPNTSGRLFAKSGLQHMSCEARHFLIGDKYTDLDFVNSNPKIMLWLAKNNGVTKENYQYLEAYCDKGRDLIMKEFPKIKDQVRELCCDPMRDVSDSKCEPLKKIAENIKFIVNKLVEKNSKEFVEEFDKDYGSYSAKMLFNKESELCNELITILKKQNIEVMTLCFDGCIVKNHPKIQKCLDEFNEAYPDFSVVIKPWRVYPEIGFINPQQWDYTDKTYFGNIDGLLSVIYRSQDLAFYKILPTLLKTTRSINWKEIYCKCVDDTDFYKVMKITAFKEYEARYYDDKGHVCKLRLVEIMKRVPELFNYNSIDFFKPTNNNFCLFQGFVPDLEKTPVPENAEELIQPVLHHLHEVWGAGDEQMTDFIINYFAYIIQNYPVKTESILIFTGDEGTGKSMLLDWMMDNIFGHMALTLTGSDKLTRNFNAHLAGKLIVCMEELKSEGEDYRHNSNRIKQLATGKWLDVERKGIDLCRVINTINMIGFSNYRNPLSAVKGINRRLILQEVSSIYKGNKEYFRKLAKTLDNPLTAVAFLHYLRSIQVDINKLRFDKPNTKSKISSVFDALVPIERALYIWKIVQDSSTYDQTSPKGYVCAEDLIKILEKYFDIKKSPTAVGKEIGAMFPNGKARTSTKNYRKYDTYEFDIDLLKLASDRAFDMGLNNQSQFALDDYDQEIILDNDEIKAQESKFGFLGF